MKKCFVLILILCLLAAGVYTSTPSGSPSFYFDSYGDLDWEWEKARLDNFAVFLSNNPAFVGHIFVWAGKHSCKGEAQARAMRAKTYLVDYRKVKWNRVIWHDVGYSSELNTILEPMGPFPSYAPGLRASMQSETRFGNRCDHPMETDTPIAKVTAKELNDRTSIRIHKIRNRIFKKVPPNV